MPAYVLDTNVLITAMRDAAFNAALAAWQRAMAPSLYQSSVVLGELLSGARDRDTWHRWHHHWVDPADRMGRITTPNGRDWLDASRAVADLSGAGIIRRGVVQPSFFNDCLLAVTSRRHGQVVVTSNRRDFERIGEVVAGLQFTAPLP